jgi:hypothetical protein
MWAPSGPAKSAHFTEVPIIGKFSIFFGTYKYLVEINFWMHKVIFFLLFNNLSIQTTTSFPEISTFFIRGKSTRVVMILCY